MFLCLDAAWISEGSPTGTKTRGLSPCQARSERRVPYGVWGDVSHVLSTTPWTRRQSETGRQLQKGDRNTGKLCTGDERYKRNKQRGCQQVLKWTQNSQSTTSKCWTNLDGKDSRSDRTGTTDLPSSRFTGSSKPSQCKHARAPRPWDRVPQRGLRPPQGEPLSSFRWLLSSHASASCDYVCLQGMRRTTWEGKRRDGSISARLALTDLGWRMDWNNSHPNAIDGLEQFPSVTLQYNSLQNTFLHMPGRLEFSCRWMQCYFSMCNSWLKLFVPTTTGWTDSFTAEMKQLVASNTACFWPTLFLQCEFDAVKLLQKPCQVDVYMPLYAAIGSTWPKGPWALPRKMVCGTLGACTRNYPRRTSNLECGLSWFGYFNWTLHRKQENSPVPVFPQLLCTPRTSSRPPPTCPASPRPWLSCSPRGACRGVGVPVGTRGLPMLGAGDLLPGGSRWSAKVVKHEKSSRSRGFMADLWERVKVNEGHNSWTSGMKMLFQALVKQSLNSERGATKNYDTCLRLR